MRIYFNLKTQGKANPSPNLLLLYLKETLFRQKSKTFLDWLVVLDSWLCVCNIASFVGMIMPTGSDYFCSTLAPFCFLINLLNRLLTVAVVIYRKATVNS